MSPKWVLTFSAALARRGYSDTQILEMYEIAMKTGRNWRPEQAEAEWKRINADS